MKKGICDQSGIALIEALVSAVLLTIVAAGTFSYFSASTRATAQERHRAQANNLAEADLERLRSMPVTCPKTAPTCTYSVANIVGSPQSQTVTQDATPYTVVSRAQYQNDPSISTDCSAGAGSRDYVAISSTVTWPDIGSRPPVTASSIVTPPSGSFVPNTGSLRINVVDSRGNPISGATITGSAISPTQGSFSGTTNSAGCVLWKNVPSGNFSVTLGGAVSSMVDKDGNSPNQPQPTQIGVVDQNSTTVDLLYDTPGSISNITFKTRNYSNALVASSADGVIVNNSNMNLGKPFTLGSRAASISTNQTLFPFTSTYWIYGGRCALSNPDPTGGGQNAAAIGHATVPIGAAGTLDSPGYIQLPSLQVTVKNGSSNVSGAQVTARDTGTGCGSFVRTLTPATGTNSSGQVPQLDCSGSCFGPASEIGLPYGTYQVCATGGGKKRTVTQALTSVGSTGTPLTVDLSGGTTGTSCP
jgi:Tfp pilus assembly protein PilV